MPRSLTRAGHRGASTAPQRWQQCTSAPCCPSPMQVRAADGGEHPSSLGGHSQASFQEPTFGEVKPPPLLLRSLPLLWVPRGTSHVPLPPLLPSSAPPRQPAARATSPPPSAPHRPSPLPPTSGDSRAILSRGDVAVRLSRDHTPDVASERRRIEGVGGVVRHLKVGTGPTPKIWRVDPYLKVVEIAPDLCCSSIQHSHPAHDVK